MAASEMTELKERLAAIEHERWAHWQDYMHAQCYPGPPSAPGSLLIPAELVQRWERQIGTPYEALSEAEKNSYHEQVDRYWPLIQTLDTDWRTRLLIEVDHVARYGGLLVKHSMFAYPHLWLWHALFDGTWLCRCWHSQEMK